LDGRLAIQCGTCSLVSWLVALSTRTRLEVQNCRSLAGQGGPPRPPMGHPWGFGRPRPQRKQPQDSATMACRMLLECIRGQVPTCLRKTAIQRRLRACHRLCFCAPPRRGPTCPPHSKHFPSTSVGPHPRLTGRPAPDSETNPNPCPIIRC
jgi:hypothetical protein